MCCAKTLRPTLAIDGYDPFAFTTFDWPCTFQVISRGTSGTISSIIDYDIVHGQSNVVKAKENKKKTVSPKQTLFKGQQRHSSFIV
jgi:hypothetical protein